MISENDLNFIQQSLGRTPRGAYKVEKYNSRNEPMVISVIPIVDQKPFPTTFWLVSKELKKRISHLEREGLISALEDEFHQNESLLDELRQNHLDYQKERALLAKTLSPEQKTAYEQHDWKKSGIGGIADWRFIKCFHLHFAHYLARENIVGKIINERYGLLKDI